MSSSPRPPYYPERRSGIDRRQGQTRMFTKYWLTGKRSIPRRKEDREKSFRVDLHSFKTLSAILVIVSLSTMDAVFTLDLIHNGATELNPVMAYFMNHGALAFFGAKYLLTAISVFLILPNKNAFLFKTRVRVKVLLLLFAVPFALVVKWELYLIFFVL